MLESLKDWLPLTAVAIAGFGYLFGSLKRGRDEAAENAIQAQMAQIQTQDATIATLRYELGTLREEQRIQATQITALQAELLLTKQQNVELNQMPPMMQLQALAADATMRVVELIGERLHPIEEAILGAVPGVPS